MQPRRRIWTWLVLGAPLLVWLGFETYGAGGALLALPAVGLFATVEEGVQRQIARLLK